jgi:catechol 2,3-dioxygenase-like lactoylglutathione lyase family enzyme
VRFSHVCICVMDVARSLRFYRDFLGFEPVLELHVDGPETAQLLRLDEADVHATFLERDGVRIELLHYAKPGTVGGTDPGPMNQRGLSHLSLAVDDVDEVLAGVEPAGGRVLKDTVVAIPKTGARAAFLTDPDGTRIELLQWPEAPA